MKAFAVATLALLERSGVTYGDVRVTSRRTEQLHVKNGILEAWSDEEEQGFGVRVLRDGFWGFASSRDLSEKEAERTVERALLAASASTVVGGEKVTLAPQHPYQDDHTGPCEEDPFALSAETKIEFLLQATEQLAAPGVTLAVGAMGAERRTTVFASTEGSLLEQTFTEAGGGIGAIAVRDNDVQRRSYPSAGEGTWGQGGFEVVRRMGWAQEAPRLAEEAVALLDAPTCPSGRATIILDADQMALQVHESIGHPTELDRILGSELMYAGSSFLGIDDLHRLRYGSEHVTVVADATLPGGLGTFAYDDEGVPAKRVPLVERGLLTGFLTSRETASRLGQASGGAMRASGWSTIPLIRMTNINLEPGRWTVDDLIADTDDGVLMATNKSWSIGDRRLNFHFATEIGWEIKGGKLGRMLRDCAYAGTTPTFWGSCDAICDAAHRTTFGVTNCGKGQPGQTMHVGHAVSPARFRDVEIGVST